MRRCASRHPRPRPIPRGLPASAPPFARWWHLPRCGCPLREGRESLDSCPARTNPEGAPETAVGLSRSCQRRRPPIRAGEPTGPRARKDAALIVLDRADKGACHPCATAVRGTGRIRQRRKAARPDRFELQVLSLAWRPFPNPSGPAVGAQRNSVIGTSRTIC